MPMLTLSSALPADETRMWIDTLFREDVPRSADHTVGMKCHMCATDMHTTARAREGFTSDCPNKVRRPAVQTASPDREDGA